MSKNNFPPGWNEEKVQKVLRHYESQTEDQAVEEDEATFGQSTSTVIEVPKELLPTIRNLIARHQAS